MAIVSIKPQGRCGNFLFTMAAAIAYAKKHNIEYSVPTKTNDEFWNPIYLKHLTNPKWRDDIQDIYVNEKEYFRYDEIDFQEHWRGKQIVLRGYFQNPKYFENDREDILKAFGFEWQYKLGYTSIHIRRGDYLKLPEKHPAVTKEWYEHAMSLFPGSKFIFYSDDIQYCIDTFGHREDCEFNTQYKDIDALVQMSFCENNIISASTFGWWGGYLNQNPNKKIVVPSQWLMPAASNQWAEEIVPKEWIRL